MNTATALRALGREGDAAEAERQAAARWARAGRARGREGGLLAGDRRRSLLQSPPVAPVSLIMEK